MTVPRATRVELHDSKVISAAAPLRAAPPADKVEPAKIGGADLLDWRALFVKRVGADRQRVTPQRLLVVDAVFGNRHFNVDELYRTVRERDDSIGYATVWRTLKLLERYGLVSCSKFHDGTARYEAHVAEAEHHDHMICTRCRCIVEFENDAIEALQRQIAASHGFVLTSHRMDLYGLCPRCQSTSL